MPGRKLKTLSAFKLDKLQKTEPKAVTENKAEIASLKSVLSQPRSNKSIVYSTRSAKKPEKLTCQTSRSSRASRPQSAVKPDTTERFSETESKTLTQRSCGLPPQNVYRSSQLWLRLSEAMFSRAQTHSIAQPTTSLVLGKMTRTVSEEWNCISCSSHRPKA